MNARYERVRPQQLTRGDGQLWRRVFWLALALFSVTAHWTGPWSTDNAGAAWPGWNFAHNGTLFLDNLPERASDQGAMVQNGHVVMSRSGGILLAGIPLQVLLRPFGLPVMVPSVLTAVLCTAAAVACLAVTLRRLGAGPRDAGAMAFAVACSSTIWTAASTELWTHSPNILFLALSMMLMASGRLLPAGLALAPALLVRPHLALVAATVGIWLMFSRRSVRPVLALGIPAAAAWGLLASFNAWYFGKWTLGGAYTYAIDRATGTGPGTTGGQLPGLPENLLGALISPYRGILVYSPWAFLVVPLIVYGLRRAPDWSNAYALGGLLYLVAQCRISSFSGGAVFYGNRYATELAVLVVPAAYVGWLRWARTRRRVLLTRLLAAVSVAIAAVGPTSPGSLPILLDETEPWRTWLFYDVLQAEGARAVAVFAAVLVLGVLAALRPPPVDQHPSPDAAEPVKQPAAALP